MTHYHEQRQQHIMKEARIMKRHIPHLEYMKIDALSNGEAQMIASNPSDYVWNKNAPSDLTNRAALDFGTALHTALLEPQLFNDSVVIYDQTKSRDTVKFDKFMETQDEKSIVLLESEYQKLRLCADSAKAHPTFKYMLDAMQEREVSIVTNLDGVDVKIRADLCCDEKGIIGDIKTTASLDDWRDSARWKNPLFKFNYGFTAAFYMDAYSAHLGKEINEYHFLACQTTIKKGKYPVVVVSVTREELERYGFFDDVYYALGEYKERKESGNWVFFESFPLIGGFSAEPEISFEE